MDNPGIKSILTGSILMAVGIILGAFGAHGLAGRIDAANLTTFETGIFYHITHSLALIVVGILTQQQSKLKVMWVFWCFVLGIAFFSGSIYLLSTREITGIGGSWLGPITPIGGTLLIAGWIILAWECRLLLRE